MFHSELSSFISKASFERMAHALVEEQLPSHTRAEYTVSVNFFILNLLVGLQATDQQDDSLDTRLGALQDRYRANAFNALGHISVLHPPSLSLLQALLAGVSSSRP